MLIRTQKKRQGPTRNPGNITNLLRVCRNSKILYYTCVFKIIPYSLMDQLFGFFVGWLARAPDAIFIENKREAYCKWCSKGLRAHRTDLELHSKTASHEKLAKEILSAGQRRIEECGAF